MPKTNLTKNTYHSKIMEYLLSVLVVRGPPYTIVYKYSADHQDLPTRFKQGHCPLHSASIYCILMYILQGLRPGAADPYVFDNKDVHLQATYDHRSIDSFRSIHRSDKSMNKQRHHLFLPTRAVGTGGDAAKQNA